MIKFTRYLRQLAVPALLLLSVTGCSANELDGYAGTTPQLKLEQFLSGPLTAHGMIQDRNGAVLRRFSARLHGHWEGDRGVLEEDFVYHDGETQRRVWHLIRLAPGHYQGRADDVVGTAEGRTQGMAFNWRYTLRIPYQGSTLDITLDDWMFLLDERRLINRAQMRKFGFKVGEITLWIERL